MVGGLERWPNNVTHIITAWLGHKVLYNAYAALTTSNPVALQISGRLFFVLRDRGYETLP